MTTIGTGESLAWCRSAAVQRFGGDYGRKLRPLGDACVFIQDEQVGDADFLSHLSLSAQLKGSVGLSISISKGHISLRALSKGPGSFGVRKRHSETAKVVF